MKKLCKEEEIESKASSEFISPHFGTGEQNEEGKSPDGNKTEHEGFSDWQSNDVIEPKHNPSARQLYHIKGKNPVAPMALSIIKE